MKIEVSRTINSAHQLHGTLLHGHTYRITAIVTATPDPSTGYAMQFHQLREVLEVCARSYDHDRLERTLSQLPATAENLATCVARSMSKELKRLVNVRVQVGDDGVVETDMYERDGEYFSR